MLTYKVANKINLNEKLAHKLTIQDIENWYLSAIKEKQFLGLEYERLSFDNKTFQNASYKKMKQIICEFSSAVDWIVDWDNDVVIGAHNQDGTSISLEPGCQLEISLSPKKDVLSIDLELNKIISLIDKIALKYNISFLGYGISPASSLDEIEVLNKRRYKVMTKYLPERHYGELSLKMMRKTAGIQFNIDYKGKKDAYLKLKFFNLIMPFMCGLCANSPLEKNRLKDMKSLRAHIWRYTGAERCNLFYKKIFSGLFKTNNVFKNYINCVLNVPMIFIERNNKIIEINGKITFDEFMKNGYLDFRATIDDYILHQSLCFPDVRLKKYIEIRNHDSSNVMMTLALCAFYRGLMLSDIEENLLKFKYLNIDDIDKYNKNIISNGLNYKINKNKTGWDVVFELFEIAKANTLSSQKYYLEPISKMLKERKTQADLIIEYDIKNTFELVEFLG